MNLDTFKINSVVFILHTDTEFIGVRLLKKFKSGTCTVQVLWTNDLPGIERGEVLTVFGDIRAQESVTVKDMLGLPDGEEQESEATV